MKLKMHHYLQRLISWYFQRVLGWSGRPVILQPEAYEHLTRAASNAIVLALQLQGLQQKLAEIGYDAETDDVYNPEYEQEFAELDEDGKWPAEPERELKLVPSDLIPKKPEDLN